MEDSAALPARTEAALNASLYESLRRLAAAQLRDERSDHTLQATALVHEAWLRLEGDFAAQSLAPGRSAESHFLALASQAMRRILIDHARAKKSSKRGGDWRKVEISSVTPAGIEASINGNVELLVLDEALTQLALVSPRQAEIVELRFFGGLSNERAAAVLGISTPTLVRDWRVAQAWLLARLADQ